jgi:nucleoside-diphosphate-sugar epimerase
MATERILIIGSNGQIGLELAEALRKNYGSENVVCSDIRKIENQLEPFEILDILDLNTLHQIVKKYQITQVYLLAALLSATAEKNPKFAWDLNMNGLFHVLDMAKEGLIKKVYWPSSIAVFGPSTPRVLTPQYTVMASRRKILRILSPKVRCRCTQHSLPWLNWLEECTRWWYHRLCSTHLS